MNLVIRRIHYGHLVVIQKWTRQLLIGYNFEMPQELFIIEFQ